MAFFDDIFAQLEKSPQHHVRTESMWNGWQKKVRPEIEKSFSTPEGVPVPFGPFGDLRFPYYAMGSITSLDLFGLDELIIFAFYHHNRKRYTKVVDFGANIGLHSLIMAKCGWHVRSFEPDPVHAALLTKNLALNHVSTELHQAAVSLKDGQTEFVRVLGNTTGSHIAGAKSNPYGELERFSVKLEAAEPQLAWADLAKIDIEGHEGELITGLDPTVWQKTDAMMEVGTPENAAKIFDHLSGGKSNMFAQKIGWKKVTKLSDMPTSHREGALFLSSKDQMPWN